MDRKSPIRTKPLRVPGQSLDEEIALWRNERLVDYAFIAACLLVLAITEWIGYLTHSPRHPILYSAIAVIACVVAVWRAFGIRKTVEKLRLGRDGERTVGQFLENLRNGGGQVFHDIPGEGFNIDHVVVSTHGIYAIETKTRSKPSPKATITVQGDHLLVAGKRPDRNPIDQAAASARWLERLLEESTGKQFKVRGVVVFPGWWIEQRSPRSAVWVLEPKALPAFISQEPETIVPSDVSLAASHLSRYIRSAADSLN